jgi:hypothetical protein
MFGCMTNTGIMVAIEIKERLIELGVCCINLTPDNEWAY